MTQPFPSAVHEPAALYAFFFLPVGGNNDDLGDDVVGD